VLGAGGGIGLAAVDLARVLGLRPIAEVSLDLSGAHTIGVERETGSVAVTTAANLKLDPAAAADPLRVIDQSELAETDRALISRPVLLAYRYTGEAFKLDLAVRRHQELPVLDAVADRTQITSVLTESGEMLTQASFMVKNNDRQFQRFQLPPGATFWKKFDAFSAVFRKTSCAEKENLLVPDLVTTSTTAPPLRPYSAFMAPVTTRNSDIAFGEIWDTESGMLIARSLESVPSSRKLFDWARCPFTENCPTVVLGPPDVETMPGCRDIRSTTLTTRIFTS
jgi:hypothetical protein